MGRHVKSESLPVLPLRNSVLFPRLAMPLSVGRPASIAAVQAALASEGKEILIVSQRDPSADSPGQEDLYGVGTKALIKQITRSGDDQMEVLVVGVERVEIQSLEQSEPYLKAQVRPLPPPDDQGPEVEALHRAVLDLAAKAWSLVRPGTPEELRKFLVVDEDPTLLAYALGSMLSLDVAKAQALLEARTRREALKLIHSYLSYEVQILELRSKIQHEAQAELSKEQREYFLRQQLRTIQQELGDKNPEQAEKDMLLERVEKADLPELVRRELRREVSRLERLPASAPDYHVTRTYLEFALELPWRVSTQDNLDIARARQVLDEDHFDLKEVKERILEHLAVLKLNPQAKAPILCFVGPPGVGKTSLGQSIARALGRKFERFSLGGLHDEAELRGHRRTYIGAMPGRILQAIRRSGANNPVLMLDEVDKLGRDFRGDPAAALLEILDPEQNSSFRDNYLDLPFDLSKVLFITTANTVDSIQRPLLDRMEVLRLAGYSMEEKLEIARRYLIPRQIKENGLSDGQCTISDEALREIVSSYTREAGLRQLERMIARVIRKLALRHAEGRAERVTVRPEDLPDLLGPKPFFPEHLRAELQPGVATGLAWTESGGEVLYIEAALLPEGKGLTLTGQLGDVMKESAQAAQSYVWSHSHELGIDRSLFLKSGIHIHVPAGAIPKDGPSAGVTIAAALASLCTGVPARSDTAMTGEITLTGLVLPVGGVKEKVLAARRAGIRRIILPRENRKDLADLPEHVRDETEFIFADHISDVLAAALAHSGFAVGAAPSPEPTPSEEAVPA
jgi:ATP-dependent Lon protease